jgi:hypothetical protein
MDEDSLRGEADDEVQAVAGAPDADRFVDLPFEMERDLAGSISDPAVRAALPDAVKACGIGTSNEVALVVDMDILGGASWYCDALLSFRKRHPNVPVVCVSRSFRDSDLSLERLPVADASTPPVSWDVLERAILPTAIANNAIWQDRVRVLRGGVGMRWRRALRLAVQADRAPSSPSESCLDQAAALATGAVIPDDGASTDLVADRLEASRERDAGLTPASEALRSCYQRLQGAEAELKAVAHALRLLDAREGGDPIWASGHGRRPSSPPR